MNCTVRNTSPIGFGLEFALRLTLFFGKVCVEYLILVLYNTFVQPKNATLNSV